MKKMIVVLAVLVSTVSFASPSVGDSATYEGTMYIFDQPVNFKKLIHLTEYNQNTDSFKQVETTLSISEDGVEQVEVDESWIASSELGSDAEMEEMLKNCSSVGGSNSNIVIRAGTFKACVFRNESQSIALGRVPFNVLSIQGPELTYELTSFNRGN